MDTELRIISTVSSADTFANRFSTSRGANISWVSIILFIIGRNLMGCCNCG